jgi:hypothetical protein
MNDNSDYFAPVGSVAQNQSKRSGWATLIPALGLGTMAAIVCGFSLVMVSGPALAQSHSFAVKTEQGESLQCQPSTATPASAICERSTTTSSVQPIDGATDNMLLKLIYLGLPGAVLVGISFRTLHLHRQLMRQRAFVESLERIWDRTVSY